MDTGKWLKEVARTVDSRDADDFVRCLTEDASFRFGNQAVVKGKKAIRNYVANFFSMIKGAEHKVLKFWQDDNSIVWQGEVTYTRLDEKKVTVNFVNVFYMSGNLIRDYLIYIDNAPLFA